MTGRHDPPPPFRLNWPPADGADTGHPPTDRVTVDSFLRDSDIVARKLRAIADDQRVSAGLFPRPIMDRVRDRAADRRDGYSVRRYRGVHRSGAWTVDALTEAVIAQRSADRAAHRRSLRRPVSSGPVYLGERPTAIRFYGVPGPSPDAEALRGTITLAADDDGPPMWTLEVPVLPGPPGPGEPPAADDADTGPLVWQPATAMLADMFEPWPSVSALEGAHRGE